jgi:nicotinamide mononucleotide transporter
VATADEALAMRRAITLAGRGLSSTSPSPSPSPVVGCVVLDADGQVAGEGWHQHRDSGEVTVRFATWRERAWLLAATAAATLAVGGLFVAFPALPWNPWPVAYIVVGALAAMIAQARCRVEFCFVSLAVDLVGVPIAFISSLAFSGLALSGLAFSGLVYGIYSALVILGMRAWWLRTRAPRTRPDTALEGAAA